MFKIPQNVTRVSYGQELQSSTLVRVLSIIHLRGFDSRMPWDRYQHVLIKSVVGSCDLGSLLSGHGLLITYSQYSKLAIHNSQLNIIGDADMI